MTKRQTTTNTTTRPRFIKTDEAAALLGLSHRTLEAMRQRGGGPIYIRLSARAIRYRADDLQRWLESRVRQSTADGKAA